MGSSIGVSRVTGPVELARAVDEALRYDDVVLMEEAITARELLCGVIGDADEAQACVPSELKVSGDFSDYAQKYLAGATVVSPADVPADASPSGCARCRSWRSALSAATAWPGSTSCTTRRPAGCTSGKSTRCPGSPPVRSSPGAGPRAGCHTSQLLDRLIGLAFDPARART